MTDFSCIPCAGLDCFGLSNVDERQRCTAERHPCPYRQRRSDADRWQCRCCATCTVRCREQAEFLATFAKGKDGCD